MFNQSGKKTRRIEKVNVRTITLISVLTIITVGYLYSLQNPALAEKPLISASNLVYYSDAFGIKMQYPGDWTYKHLRLDNENITVAKFTFCPDPRVNVALTIDKLPKDATLEQYTNEKIKIVSSLTPSILFSNQIIQHNNTRINTYPGYEMTVESNIPLFWNFYSTISTHYWTVLNTTAYEIVYTAPSDEHSVYLPVMNEMVDSFQIGVNGALRTVPSNTSYDNASVYTLPQLC